MESSDFQAQNHFLNDQKPVMNSGLTRYQSAPSSYFASFMDSCDDFLRPSSPETERIFAGLLNADNNTNSNSSSNLNSISNLCEPKQEPQVREETVMDTNTRFQSYSASSQGFNYQSQSKPPLPDHGSGSGLDYRMVGSMGLERMSPMKVGCGNNSNLVRHSSSPAGLFSDINIEFENGYAMVRGIGDFGTGNKDASCVVSSRQSSASGRMSPIAENKMMGENSIAADGGFLEAGNNNYVTGFGMGSWDDTTMMPAGSKGLTEQDRTFSGPSETWTSDTGKPPRMLAHHLSLPKTTSAELSAVEKFLQFTDSVPCKIRAKRGCATHPRSIAERVRRTRISERMRKLQDLVPNMDKQTNTADMLDLAVDYIKELQRQVKILSESRAKCTCTN